MASACKACMSEGYEAIFEDSSNYEAHLQSNYVTENADPEKPVEGDPLAGPEQNDNVARRILQHLGFL